MPSAVNSYALKIEGVILPPLRDPDGKAYPWMPCMDDPVAWDEDRPANVRRNAAKLCETECPALAACEQRRSMLGAAARGVWAGKDCRNGNQRVQDLIAVAVSVQVKRRRSRVLPDAPDRVTIVDIVAAGRR